MRLLILFFLLASPTLHAQRSQKLFTLVHPNTLGPSIVNVLKNYPGCQLQSLTLKGEEAIEQVHVAILSANRHNQELYDARKLISTLSKDLLKAINQDSTLNPYLSSLPADIYNLSLSLQYQNSEGERAVSKITTFKGDEISFLFADGHSHQESLHDSVKAIDKKASTHWIGKRYPKNPNPQDYEYYPLIQAALKRIEDELQQQGFQVKTKLHFLKTGKEQNLDQIDYLYVSLTREEKAKVPEARQSVVEAVETLLKEINDDEQLRPYLASYPFTIQNLDLTLKLHDINKKTPRYHQVTEVRQIRDHVFYRHRSKKGPYRQFLHEPYQEALSEKTKRAQHG